MCEVAYHHVVE